MSIDTYIKTHLNRQVINKTSVGTGLFDAYKVALDNGKYVFIKHQHKGNNQLINEGKELELLGKTIHTPKVLASCENYLVLEWIEQEFNPNIQGQMGEALAKLHQNKNSFFGFNFDNKIGQTPQLNAVNKNITNWSAFFWQYRLLYQIELAYEKKLINKNDYRNLLKIEKILPNLLDNNIKPSLLHGDLWSGNVISGKNHPYFIDSASYYGHREADLALTFMFGGFDDSFYNAYNKQYPLKKDFKNRKHLYMLYHYLNHLNLFGSSYYSQVVNCYNQI